MDYKNRAKSELQEKLCNQNGKHIVVGLDGFVDTILHLVAKRHGLGEDFDRIGTIESFGNRILAASGKSTNIEMFPKMDKLGGNGPILANAMVSAGYPVRYIGSLGEPNIHPIFQAFADKTNAISISAPGLTNAIEFTDGKVMMGITKTLEEISYDSIIRKMGEQAFVDELAQSTLLALVNWTMIPNMTQIFKDLLDKVLPDLAPISGGRSFFFDLADPEKRADEELKEALELISTFEKHGSVIVGLNLKEGQRVCEVLGIDEAGEELESLKRMTTKIRSALNINAVVVHPKERAACATADGAWCVEGPYVQNPVITTGAGDHFNAGFCSAQQLELSPEACLTVGVCFSGHYVRTAKSPSLNDIDTFLGNW